MDKKLELESRVKKLENFLKMKMKILLEKSLLTLAKMYMRP
jgi:hypothetical protein